MQVVTAQYFVWYFSLAPLALCRLQPGSQVPARHCSTTCSKLLHHELHAVMSVLPPKPQPPPVSSHLSNSSELGTPALVRRQGRVAAAAAAWAAAAAHWLAWAYLLEFRGAPVHLAVWAAGLAFLAANVVLLCVLAAGFAQNSKVQPAQLQQCRTDMLCSDSAHADFDQRQWPVRDSLRFHMMPGSF